jgi:uncharacterized delta-60 repeat protein
VRRHSRGAAAAGGRRRFERAVGEVLEQRALLSTGAIAGTVYADPGQSGVATGNVGLGGRQVYVDLAGNGAYTVGDPTATTAADGAYSITGLAAGTYTLHEVVPVGWGQTAPGAAAVPVTVTAGGTTEQDFGNLQLGSAASFDLNADGTVANFTALNSALQTDGKIVVVGYSGTEAAKDEKSVVARYFPDGTPDLRFGTNGSVVQSIQSSESIATAVLVEPDGQIVVAGSYQIDLGFPGHTEGYAERLNADGSLDPSFDVLSESGSNTDSAPQGLVLLPDGSVLLSGSTYSDNGKEILPGTGSSILIDLENADGSLNPAFGDFQGYSNVVIPNNGGDLSGAQAVVDPATGDIYLAGTVTYDDDAVSEFVLEGFTPDGKYDAYEALEFPNGPSDATAAVVQPDGKVLVVGEALGDADDDFGLARFTPDAADATFVPDTTFGTDGTGTVTTDFGGIDGATSVQLLPDGTFIVAGTSSFDDGSGDVSDVDDVVEHYAADGTPLGGTVSDGETNLGVDPGVPVFANAAPAFVGVAAAVGTDGAQPTFVNASIGFPPPYTPVVVGSQSAKDVTVESAAPSVAYVAPAAVTVAGSAAPEVLRVQYTDPIGIDLRTLSSGNLQVTLPGGATEPAAYLGVEANGNTQDLTADYSVPAPAGGWVAADDGTYQVSLQAGQVRNTAVAAAAVADLGSFTVNVSGTPGTPTPTPTATPLASTVAVTAAVAAVDAGNVVLFTATVTGVAGGAAPTGIVTFFDGSIVLGTAAVAGGAATFSTAALPAGADAVTAVYSGDATYTTSTSAATTVTVAAPAAGAAALTPSLSAVALPAALVAGAAHKLSIPVTVADTGKAAFHGEVTVNLYASADASLDAGDVTIDTVRRPASAKAGRSTKVTVTLAGLPASLASGTYHLLAQVIDPSGFAQTAATAGTVTVAAPFVSPAVTFAASTAAVINGQKRGPVAISILNNGNVAIGGPVTVTLYETATGAVDAQSSKLGTITRRLSVPPAKAKATSVPVTLPTSLAAGTYQLVAVVTTTAGGGAAAATTTTFDPVPFTVSP